MAELNGIQIFAGYNIKYPEYEVITPQRKQSFTVRTLTTSEEEQLKGSILTPNTIAEHLTQVLWSCIVKKPDYIKTYDDFIKMVTLRDRDCLVYGLFVATYKDTQGFSYTCPECGFKNKIKIDMEKGFNFQMWDQPTDCIEARIKVPLVILSGVECVLKVPVIADEIELSKKSMDVSQEDSQLMTDLLMIQSFELPPIKEKKVNEEGKEIEVMNHVSITERDKILEAYKVLPAYDRKLVTKEYLEKLDKYRIGVAAKSKCRCGYEQEVRIDVTRQFFQSLLG